MLGRLAADPVVWYASSARRRHWLDGMAVFQDRAGWASMCVRCLIALRLDPQSRDVTIVAAQPAERIAPPSAGEQRQY